MEIGIFYIKRFIPLCSRIGIIIISKYVSILSVGLKLNINEIESEYTLYQLFEQQKRFSLKEQNDIYLKAKLAGAKDLKEIDNWMDDIHP